MVAKCHNSNPGHGFKLHITIENFNIGLLTVIIKDAKGLTDNIRSIVLYRM